jgi:ADP-ribose pyrophosphatase
MSEWKTISSRTVADFGKWLTVEDRTVEAPGGQVIEGWAWVTPPDYVNVAVVDEEGNFCCFRQTKYAIQEGSLAIVGGYIEPDEDPAVAAQREVLEEMGYVSTEWVNLGSYVVEANRGMGKANLFLAKNARFVGLSGTSDDLEPLEFVKLSRAEVVAALNNNEFRLLGWALTISLSLSHV